MNDLWLGIDPGGRSTGYVVRAGKDVVRALTEVRDDDTTPLEFARVCAHTVEELVAQYMGNVNIAIESFSKPSVYMHGRKQVLDPSNMFATCMTLGAVYVASPAPVWMVPPGGNGSRPMEAYPVELRPIRGKGKGGDKLRHVRSAWDVSLIGERLAQRGQPTP